MIIKKNKKNEDNAQKNQSATSKSAKNINSIPEKPETNFDLSKSEQDIFSIITSREERRRGDRRRGYKRIDDRDLISKAHEEANSIKELAAKEGYEKGLMQSQAILNNLNNAIEQFLGAKEAALESVMNDISFIAVKAAEKIIKTEIACDESIVLSIIEDVIKEFEKTESLITIRTNPADTQYVQQNFPKVFPSNKVKAKIEIVDDETVDWGSCIVETKNGIVDANFSTQLQLIQRAFEIGLNTD